VNKNTYGDLLRSARIRKGLSLRGLAVRAGLDYSRLARIERGTRPSPDLAASRSLAEILDLDLATLLVAAGTSREVLGGIVWSERRELGERHPEIAEYDPGDVDMIRKNTFDVRVIERSDSRCLVRLGSLDLAVFSFSNGARLRIAIPPEAVVVFREDPRPVLGHGEGVFTMRMAKIRHLGGATNLVLAGCGIEINALNDREAVEAAGHAIGDTVHALIPGAAVRTEPSAESNGTGKGTQ